MLFVRDTLLSLMLTFILAPPIVAAIVNIVYWGGSYFVPFLFVFLILLTLVMMIIYPSFIAPLFNKFTPLEEGSLRTRIEELASELNFPLK